MFSKWNKRRYVCDIVDYSRIATWIVSRLLNFSYLHTLSRRLKYMFYGMIFKYFGDTELQPEIYIIISTHTLQDDVSIIYDHNKITNG